MKEHFEWKYTAVDQRMLRRGSMHTYTGSPSTSDHILKGQCHIAKLNLTKGYRLGEESVVITSSNNYVLAHRSEVMSPDQK